MSFNKVIIVGHCGKDVELKYSKDGKTAFANVSMATSQKRGDQEATTWFNITFFGKLAEVAAQYLGKGKQAYVEGRLSLEEFEDRDGNKRTSLKVAATELQLLGSAEKGESKSEPKAKATAANTPDEEDIPF